MRPVYLSRFEGRAPSPARGNGAPPGARLYCLRPPFPASVLPVPAVQRPRGKPKPVILTERIEELLKTIHLYRYMTALDVAHRLYSPASITYVRGLLASLCGGEDCKPNQYLYRFSLPTTSVGTKEKIYTLGSRGRDFLAREVGLPVDWYFRPHKVRHLSYGQLLHHLILTRFLVAASCWADKAENFRLAQTRTSYELSRQAPTVALAEERGKELRKVIPDAWLLLEKLKDGAHACFFPILLEIDRGMEYQHKFKEHVRARIAFVKQGGAYTQLFGQSAVTIAYVTTGQRPEYRESRRAAMCAWTQEVLAELNKERWAAVFRFHSLALEDIYTSRLFEEPVWFRPDTEKPVGLFTP
jgi:hypothetical protein